MVHIATRAAKVTRTLKGQWQRRAAERTIAPILRQPVPPHPLEDEATFARLKREFDQRRSYSYSAWDVWQRGTTRAAALMSTCDLRTPGARVLDAGCGEGMLAAALHGYGHRLTLIDVDDWRDERARSLCFHKADLCQPLPLESDQFDLVYSYNTFEHLPAPGIAFSELVRVCRPGGQIYLKFGPLYASAWGLHAYHTLPIPYLQFLFTQEFLRAKLAEAGIYDLGGSRDDLQPLNAWRLEQFQRMWHESACAVRAADVNEELTHLSLIRRFPQAFRGRGLMFEDVITKSVWVRLRK